MRTAPLGMGLTQVAEWSWRRSESPAGQGMVPAAVSGLESSSGQDGLSEKAE